MPENKTNLKTKHIAHPSRSESRLLFKPTVRRERAHRIVPRLWLSNQLSFFLRKAFIFLGPDPTATGRQLAETAERNFGGKGYDMQGDSEHARADVVMKLLGHGFLALVPRNAAAIKPTPHQRSKSPNSWVLTG